MVSITASPSDRITLHKMYLVKFYPTVLVAPGVVFL